MLIFFQPKWSRILIKHLHAISDQEERRDVNRCHECFVVLSSKHNVVNEKSVKLLAPAASVNEVPEILKLAPLRLHLGNQNVDRILKKRLPVKLLSDQNEDT